MLSLSSATTQSTRVPLRSNSLNRVKPHSTGKFGGFDIIIICIELHSLAQICF